MTQPTGRGRSVATGPLSALLSAALLLLSMVGGVGGVGGFATVNPAAGTPHSTVAAASTIFVPVSGDRRAAPALGTPGTRQHTAGWAPHHPDPADAVLSDTRLPAGSASSPADAGPDVIALDIEVSHRGRAPPAGSLLL